MNESKQSGPIQELPSQQLALIESMRHDVGLIRYSQLWMELSSKYKYSYNFSWLGRPIIQYPQDLVATQELIWRVKPDLIIECGIAHGGSLVYYASLLALLDVFDSMASCDKAKPVEIKRKVLGVDIDIRRHNRIAIDAHPLRKWVEMIEGSSISAEVISSVKEFSKNYNRIMVCLDSNHTHDHVLSELKAYAPLVSKDSYCVVFDTIVDDMAADAFPDRPWGRGNNPKTAVHEFLKTNDEFSIDRSIDHKLLISVAPEGYLQRIR